MLKFKQGAFYLRKLLSLHSFSYCWLPTLAFKGWKGIYSQLNCQHTLFCGGAEKDLAPDNNNYSIFLGISVFLSGFLFFCLFFFSPFGLLTRLSVTFSLGSVFKAFWILTEKSYGVVPVLKQFKSGTFVCSYTMRKFVLLISFCA